MPETPPQIKYLVFDFDGTLADSFDAVCRIGLRLAREAGVSPDKPIRPEDFREMTAREIMRELQIPLSKLPGWLHRVRAELKAEVPRLRPFPGIPETVRDLVAAGMVPAVLSSNSAENINAFLRYHGLAREFAHIHTSSRLFGKGRSLKRLLHRQGFPAEETVYAGDEVRDVEAAREAGVRSVAVSWGFNARDLLAAHRPDFLLDEPRQLLDLVGPPIQRAKPSSSDGYGNTQR